MVIIFAWVIGIYLLWDYVIPFIKVSWIKLKIKRRLSKLDQKKYKVLTKVKSPTYVVRKRTELSETDFYARRDKIAIIDYLVISSAGVLGITILDLKHHFRGLRGYEDREKWTMIRFARFWLPFVDLNSYIEISNPLLETKEKLGMLRYRLQISETVPFYPIVVIVPRIRAVDLRERNPDSWVVFPEHLEKTITSMEPDHLTQETIQQLYEQISYLQVQMNIGLNSMERSESLPYSQKNKNF